MYFAIRTRYKLRLFMTASLLTTILVTPVGSMFLFTDAIAQEYGYDDDVPYKSMDNSYGRSYTSPKHHSTSYNEVYNIKRTSYNYNENIDNPIYAENAKKLNSR